MGCWSTCRTTTSPVVSLHVYARTVGSLPPSSRHCPIGGIIATSVCITKVGSVMCFLCSLLGSISVPLAGIQIPRLTLDFKLIVFISIT
mmetsp:Transcript_146504/g.255909  ORF Transcript_146504/g.255909 Transcript_146504/m.255909 type:complete len:89 (-) Transcript_146504:11-277(-)